jgi:heme oxygenase
MLEPDVNPPATVHRFLRQATASLHDAVESCSPLGELLVPSNITSRERYISILLDLYEILGALEPLAEQTVTDCTESFRRRILVERDLTWLGATPRPMRPSIARLADAMRSSSLQTRMGLAYVLMGQSLGTSMICRAMVANDHIKLRHIAPEIAPLELAQGAQALQLPPPFSFLTGHGKRTNSSWSVFLQTLERSVCVHETAARAQALAGARAGFEAFLLVWAPPADDLGTKG